MNVRERTILVTGAGGFLGPAVVQAFCRVGAKVHALTGPPGFPANPLPVEALVFQSDITDADGVSRALKGCDSVVHMAGPSAVLGSFRNPTEYTRIHMTGTATVLEACRKAGVWKFLYVSSAEVYGRTDEHRVTETDRLQARSPYAAAKIGAEKLVEAFVAASGLQATVLRPFSIYGPDMSRNSLIGTIIRGAIDRGLVTLANPDAVRDFCYVSDIAEAVVLAATTELPGLSIFNAGSGEGVAARDLVTTVGDIIGIHLAVLANGKNQRPGASDIPYLVADTRSIMKRLGWTPRISLRHGLECTIQAMKSEVGSAGSVA